MSGTGKRLVNDFGQEEIRRKLKSVLVRGKGKITPGNYRAGILACLEDAVKTKTLVRLKNGLWFCCFHGEDDQGREEWALLFLYRVVSGPAKPLSYLYPYLIGVLPRYNYEITNNYECIIKYENTSKILRLLPDNVSRTFTVKGKRIQLIAHAGKFILHKVYDAQIPEERLPYPDFKEDIDFL